MKKILLLLIVLIFSSCSFADFSPHNARSVRYYGIGVLNESKPFTIYKKPNLEAGIISEINPVVNKNSSIMFSSKDAVKLRNTFVVYSPSKNISLIAVENQEEDGWYEVIFDQSRGQKGYIHDTNDKNFYTWKNLFYSYGKTNGLKFMKGLEDKYKVLYAQDSFDSQIISPLEYPLQITFSIIRGNWLLATVKEFDGSTKIGWLNWRNDDGSLNLFPKF